MPKFIGRLSGIIVFCSLVALVLVLNGCMSTPKPFETGEKTTAPYGYTEMIKREAK
jgi:hypothetical protein